MLRKAPIDKGSAGCSAITAGGRATGSKANQTRLWVRAHGRQLAIPTWTKTITAVRRTRSVVGNGRVGAYASKLVGGAGHGHRDARSNNETMAGRRRKVKGGWCAGAGALRKG